MRELCGTNSNQGLIRDYVKTGAFLRVIPNQGLIRDYSELGSD